MKGNLLFAATGALLGMLPAAVLAAAPDIVVYQWTDARGTTHFSDAPRKDGPAKRLLLATPPPADRSAQAANRAWLAELDRDTEARLAREAAQRQAETRREAALAQERRQQAVAEQAVQRVPILYSGRRQIHRRPRRVHRGPWRFSVGAVASF
ncbi:MAG TPA: DUF4124 domain-containing protein, partial [Gammaproteobacteria bacterium]|nr:DUF4124 domain-containing protein [Gammaproteobacteria bacterium]